MDSSAGSRRITRRQLIAGGGAGLAGAAVLGLGARGSSAAGNGLNVVVVIVDSVRADHVGVYGGPASSTPNIDELARQSVRFTRPRAEAFPTIPARRAIMSGRRSFPFRNWHPTEGLPHEPGWQSIPAQQTIFTDHLHAAGYTTGYVTDNPHILGVAYDNFRPRFDRPVLVPGQVPYRGRLPGQVSRAQVLRDVLPSQRGGIVESRTREFLNANTDRAGDQDYLAARVFQAGSDWLRWAAAHQPFALVVDCFDPHEPWDPPPSVLPGNAGTYRGAKPIQAFSPPGGIMREEHFPRQALGALRALYAAELSFVDRQLGAFLDTLDSSGLGERTLVVFLSDHGVLLGERGWIGKHASQMHREITDVPFMLRHPQRIRAGATSSFRASTHDVAPTVLAGLGLPVPSYLHGRDLTPVFAGRSPGRRAHWSASYGNYLAAQEGRWLLMADNLGQTRGLFDTRADPRERRDVSARHPEQVRRLWRLIRRDAGNRPLQHY
jgi:arylsulfatase A-like enzyme